MVKLWGLGGGRRPSVLSGLLLVLFLASLGLNIFFVVRGQSDDAIDQAAKYPLLSKRIFGENQNDILINFTSLREAIRDYINAQPDQIGLYFEYLPSGTSIGVNEQMEVQLASLIKIPVAMAVYREIGLGRLSLSTVLSLQEHQIDEGFGDLWKQGVGHKLTVAEALDFMFVESDNTAMRALLDAVPPDGISQVYNALDIPQHQNGLYPILSPKNYASILRSLYLSSYLTKDDSNAILSILTRTKFNDQIVAGVPSHIRVAHKIGVFEAEEDQPTVYNDCGIVYMPNRPYALCIMVRGSKDAADKYMSYLSKMILSYLETAD